MGAMQKRKGRSGEQELARLLRDELGDQVARNLEQAREGGADIKGTPFILEVKRAATPQIPAWWRQAEAQAAAKNGIACLAYRLDRHDWQFIIPLGAIHQGFSAENTSLTVTVGLAEFIAITREAMNNQ